MKSDVADDQRPLVRGGREPWWVSFAQRLIPSQGIVVKTRSDLVAFGADLPDEEVLYLHAVVARALGVGG